ncbi:DNA primase, partial [bacterium]|nr:DNA primase [bacterium]
MINKPLIEEIRERIPISSFIGERVTLKKAGRNFKGLCPFHSEKTSSFIVSDEKQIFHCFGCGEGGDVFRFLMKFDNISFIEAVKQLASLAGITIPEDNKFARREDAELEKKRELFFRLNKVAAEFFSKNLESGESSDKVRKYLNERGIKTEFFKQLLLGATDNNWEALTTELKRIKAPLDMAAELGLIRVRANGTYYDFFRSRLIFPIVSQRGEIIGFGGRALEDGEDAKYINSPDSIIYNKSSSVYGLESAHRDIRLKDAVILVEGYFDVVSLKLSGIENVVAPLGTAITVSHLRLLSRFSKNMILIFDGDDAGVNAALRSLPLFVEQKLIPKAVLLPRGEDPDTMIQKEGKEKFLHRIESAVTLFEFFIDRIASKCGKDTSAKVEAVTKVGKLYNLLTDPVEKSIYRKRLSQALGLDENVVGERLGDSRGRIEIRSFEKRKIVESSPISAERLLIESLLRDTGKMR